MRLRRAWRRTALLAVALLLSGCQLSRATPAPPGPAPASLPLVATQGASADVATSTTSVPATPSSAAANTAPTLQPSTRLDLPASAITVLAWSPDGQTLAGSAGGRDARDHSVHLWRVDGTPLADLGGHGGPIPALAWSPDGRILASGSEDGTVRLWGATGEALRTLPLPDHLIYGLAWSPDGQTLAVGAIRVPSSTGTPRAMASNFLGTVTLWSRTGELRATLDPPRRTGGKFFRLAWSRDGRVLAGGAVSYALWRTDGTLIAALDDSATPAWGMALAPDGTVLATGDESGFLRLYSGSGVLFATFNETNVAELAFAPDGNTLAVGGGTLLDLAGTQVTKRELPMRSVPQSALVWSPDGTRLVAGFSDETVQAWRVDGQSGARFVGCGGVPILVSWSPDGRTIAATTENGHLCFWHP